MTIFCYHDITDNPSSFSKNHNLYVNPRVFEAQIKSINKYFNLITPNQIIDGNIPDKAALITFDDGFKSYFDFAVPVLEKYNTPSINFINMEVVNGATSWAGLITYLCDNKEDFIDYLKSSLGEIIDDRPYYLYCSENLVNSYLNEIGTESKETIYKDVINYVGEIANENDLDSYSASPLIFYGNHLYNHFIPILMSDNELIESFDLNNNELSKYPNSCNLFAYPFGGPGTCFSDRQTQLLLNKGVNNIFTTKSLVNDNCNYKILNRIFLSNYNDKTPLIEGQIFRYHVPKFFDSIVNNNLA